MSDPGLRAPDPDMMAVIAARLPALRKSERKVAAVVLADPDTAIAGTVADLARAAGVSDPTVIRFCEAVGCAGFQDFRIAIARGRALALHPHSIITTGDDAAAIAAKMFQYTLASLDRARRSLDASALASAIDILAASPKIDFFGFGASAIVALDAQQKFPLFGRPCIATVDAHQQYMAALTMAPGDALVAISNTGDSAAILRAVVTAAARGARVVAITGRTDSALARAADAVLVVETHENTNAYTPTTSRLAALVVIDILSTGVALRLDADHAARMAEMKDALARMRSGEDAR